MHCATSCQRETCRYRTAVMRTVLCLPAMTKIWMGSWTRVRDCSTVRLKLAKARLMTSMTLTADKQTPKATFHLPPSLRASMPWRSVLSRMQRSSSASR